MTQFTSRIHHSAQFIRERSGRVRERLRPQNLHAPSLDWFADVQSRNPKAPPGPLRQYDYHWIGKSSGSSRLIVTITPVRVNAVDMGG